MPNCICAALWRSQFGGSLAPIMRGQRIRSSVVASTAHTSDVVLIVGRAYCLEWCLDAVRPCIDPAHMGMRPRGVMLPFPTMRWDDLLEDHDDVLLRSI